MGRTDRRFAPRKCHSQQGSRSERVIRSTTEEDQRRCEAMSDHGKRWYSWRPIFEFRRVVEHGVLWRC